VMHEKAAVGADSGDLGGFEGEEPDWSSASSNVCFPKEAGPAPSMHCTPAAAPAVGL
jgi:hypothetical protein